MTFEPALHLHFEISNDCTKCCPRVFSCLCCKGEKDEYIVDRKGNLFAVVHASKSKRIKTNERLFNHLIPDKITESRWHDIKPLFEELSQIDIRDSIDVGDPLTTEKLEMIARVINGIL